MRRSHYILALWLLLTCLLPQTACAAEKPPEHFAMMPVLYNDRYIPLEAYARLWIRNLYRADQFSPEDSSTYGLTTPTAFLWNLQLQGIEPFAHIPLFWIQSHRLKKKLRLDTAQLRFSFNDLRISLEKKSYAILSRKKDKKELILLLKNLYAFSAFSTTPRFSTEQLRLIPLAGKKEDWAPLPALASSANITPYSLAQFQALRDSYSRFQQAVELPDKEMHLNQLFSLLFDNYLSLAGTSSYPTLLQLKAETIYAKYPLKIGTWGLYILSLVFFMSYRFLGKGYLKISAFSLVGLAFFCHTLLLLLRSYILQQPPLSTAFETTLFLSWIIVLASFLLGSVNKSATCLFTGIAAAALLFSGSLGMKDTLSALQPLLNSHYWLTMHLLAATASYGSVLLASVLGHWYLMQREKNIKIPGWIMQMNYSAVFFLISATFLGALWTKQNTGHFWVWTPQEACALVSIGAYLIVIYARQSKLISSTGIALGSSLIALFITLYWHHVYYITAEGSYSFGAGKNMFYYLFVGFDLALLTLLAFLQKRVTRQKNLS